MERPENVSVAFGEDAVFSCKTHKALREFTSWVRLTGNDIIELEEGTEVLRIHNVTESDLVRQDQRYIDGSRSVPVLI